MGVRVFSVVGVFDVISKDKQCVVCSFHGAVAVCTASDEQIPASLRNFHSQD
jgi:hypothetical protein